MVLAGLTLQITVVALEGAGVTDQVVRVIPPLIPRGAIQLVADVPGQGLLS